MLHVVGGSNKRLAGHKQAGPAGMACRCESSRKHPGICGSDIRTMVLHAILVPRETLRSTGSLICVIRASMQHRVREAPLGRVCRTSRCSVAVQRLDDSYTRSPKGVSKGWGATKRGAILT